MNTANIRHRFTESILPHTALLIYTVIALFPIFLVIINSFKARKAIFRAPLALPNAETFSLEGYITVWERAGFPLYFRNSLVVTLASIFFILFFGAMAAYALSEYKFRGNTLLGLYLALGIMIPIRLGTVGILRMVASMGLVNNLMGLIFVYIAPGLAADDFCAAKFYEPGATGDEGGCAGGWRQRIPHLWSCAADGAACCSDCGGFCVDPDLE